MLKNAILTVIFLSTSIFTSISADETRDKRIDQLLSALTRGSHLRWALEFEKKRDYKPEDKERFELYDTGLSLTKIKELRALAVKMIDEFPVDTVNWVNSKENGISSFDVQKAVDELNSVKLPASEKLPFNIFCKYFNEKAGQKKERAVSAFSIVLLETFHTQKWDTQENLMQLFAKIDIAFTPDQMGIKLDELMAKRMGIDLKNLLPYIPLTRKDKNEVALGMAITIIDNNGDKISGFRDSRVIGKELLEDPEIKALIPFFKAMKPRKFIFFGNSLTMAKHWCTKGAWENIALEAIKQVNPGIDYKVFSRHGTSFSILDGSDVADFGVGSMKDALVYKPDEAYILLDHELNYNNGKSLKTGIEALRGAGCNTFYVIDGVRPWSNPTINPAVATDLGAVFVEFQKTPEIGKYARNKWIGYDGIHGTTFLHTYFAKVYLKWLAEKERQATS